LRKFPSPFAATSVIGLTGIYRMIVGSLRNPSSR
jgi:hypothetical protein